MSPLDAALDARLAELARRPAGRTEAVASLFASLRAPLLSLCLHLTGRRDDAEDAVQESFVAVQRGIGQFRGEARLSSWVYGIAIRTAWEVRAKRRHGEPLGEHLEDAAAAPDERAASREGFRRVLAALEKLPAEQRLVLSLFAVDGLRHGQIAEILGVPEGTVWSRLHLARKRLLEYVGPRA